MGAIIMILFVMIFIAEKLTLIIISSILIYPPCVFLYKFITLFSIKKYWLLRAVQSLETNRIIGISVNGNFPTLFSHFYQIFDAFVGVLGVRLEDTTSYPKKGYFKGETVIWCKLFYLTMSLCSYSWTLEATIRGFF